MASAKLTVSRFGAVLHSFKNIQGRKYHRYSPEVALPIRKAEPKWGTAEEVMKVLKSGT